jgi:hypothetical protein
MSEKYGWALDAEDGAHGPFDSEAEALADAKEVLCGDEPLTGKFYEVPVRVHRPGPVHLARRG